MGADHSCVQLAVVSVVTWMSRDSSARTTAAVILVAMDRSGFRCSDDSRLRRPETPAAPTATNGPGVLAVAVAGYRGNLVRLLPLCPLDSEEHTAKRVKEIARTKVISALGAAHACLTVTLASSGASECLSFYK